jgi:HAD superfamily hydrolase (TIGR01484 family)
MAEFSGVKLVISDVDGTLLTETKVLTERARQAVFDLKANGIRFAITSGRPPRGMAMLIEPLRMEEPVAAFNGGMFTRPDLTILQSHTLSPDVSALAVGEIEHRGLAAWVYTGQDWYNFLRA